MNRISDLWDRFATGNLPKHEYIDACFEGFHSSALAMHDWLRRTGIKSIESGNGGVLYVFRSEPA